MASGGKREGAGRKAPEGRRVTMSVRVLPETREKLERLSGERQIGKYIDHLVESL